MKKFLVMAIAAITLLLNGEDLQAKGYNRLGLSYDLETFSADYLDEPNLNGFGISYLHGFSVSPKLPLYVETGIKMYTGFWGDSYYEDYYDEKTDLSITKLSFCIPVNVAYKFTFGEGKMGLSPYLGLNLKFNALAKLTEKYDGESESISLFDKDLDIDANRVQIGWHLGAVFNYAHIFAGLSYGTDFNRFCYQNNSTNFAVTLGYQF